MALRFFSLRAGAVALCAVVPVAAQALSAPDVLNRVSQTYRNVKSIDVTAHQQVQVAGGGASAVAESQLTFSMTGGGKYLLAVKGAEREFTMVSDGENTWRYVPKARQWSRESASAAAAETEEDEDQPSQKKESTDPLTEAQRTLIDRYTHLDRLAPAARLERTERIKVDGNKIDCYKLILLLPNGAHELLVDQQRFIVLRHIENRKIEWNGMAAEQRTMLTVRQIDTSAPPASRFAFSPPPKTTEVSMLILPGEDRVNLTGKVAADFTLKDLDGTKVTLSDLRGKIVLLDFWATWCPPCRRELPCVARLHQTLKDKDVVVLGVNDESSSIVKSYLKKNELTLPVLMDGSGSIHKLYGARSIPTVVIIDRSGTISAYYIGGRSEQDLMNALKGAGLEI